MKLGVVGKGGVGKTTVSALLTGAYVRRGANFPEPPTRPPAARRWSTPHWRACRSCAPR